MPSLTRKCMVLPPRSIAANAVTRGKYVDMECYL